MNERIKQLALQADEWFEEDGHSYSRSAWNEKFAELIVKECWALVDFDNKQYIKAQFKEHFGVEE